MTWFVLFLGLLVGGQPQGKATPQTYTLDFVVGTTAAAQLGSKAQKIRPPRVAPGSGGEPLPFELTLVSLDRNGYATGDDAVFEVLLKYVGTTALTFPWSREVAAVSDAPRAQIVHLLLAFKDPMLGSQLVGFDNTLYGADTLPGTMLVLRPGDSISVRAAARWWLSRGYAQRPEPAWVRSLSVRAQLQLQGTKRFTPLIESANALTIELRQRQ